MCKSAHNLVATSSVDKTVKLWDFSSQPEEVYSKDMRAGELFTCEFYEDSPSILATGGNKGMLAIWDIHENKQLAQKFWG